MPWQWITDYIIYRLAYWAVVDEWAQSLMLHAGW